MSRRENIEVDFRKQTQWSLIGSAEKLRVLAQMVKPFLGSTLSCLSKTELAGGSPATKATKQPQPRV